MIGRIRYYFALRKARRRYMLLGRMIDAIDCAFTKNGISRKKRKQFWYDFILRPESRKKFIQEMGKSG